MAVRKETNKIVVHCSATRGSQDIGVDEIRQWHLANGWSDVGYHIVIRRSGIVEYGRHLNVTGIHVRGHNSDSIGVCLVGGLKEDGSSDLPFGGFTDEQIHSLSKVLSFLEMSYPDAEVLGHRDLSPDLDGDGEVERHEWLKDCPCFDVREWWSADFV